MLFDRIYSTAVSVFMGSNFAIPIIKLEGAKSTRSYIRKGNEERGEKQVLLIFWPKK